MGNEHKEYNHQGNDSPKNPGNDMAKSKNIIDQEIGSFQKASDTPMGYPEGHSMPALFGWVTQEYQSRIAKELVEMGKNITPVSKKEKEKNK